MSSNLAVVNFTVGGTLVCSGTVTLAQGITVSFPSSFQGITTSDLYTTGNTTFNNLPTSNQTPENSNQLTTKTYVDTKDLAQKNYIDIADSRITKTVSDQKIYIDLADSSLNTSMNLLNLEMKNYVDSKMLILNNRITSVDDAWRYELNLTNIRVQALENKNLPPPRGSQLQKVTYGSSLGNNLLKNSAFFDTKIFTYSITPLSTNSTINIAFYLTGYYAGGQDAHNIASYINLYQSNTSSTTTLNRITVYLPSSNLIFPNSTSFQNTSLSQSTLEVWAVVSGTSDVNDTIILNNNVDWTCNITEVQN